MRKPLKRGSGGGGLLQDPMRRCPLASVSVDQAIPIPEVSTAPDLGVLGGLHRSIREDLVVSSCHVTVAELVQADVTLPRQELNPRALGELAKDLREGQPIREPIILRRTDSESKARGARWEVLSGQHRIAAAKEANVASLPAHVVRCSGGEALAAVLREGFSSGTERSFLEQAWGLARWIDMEDFGGTQRELANRLNRNESWVSEARRIARALPEGKVRRMAEEMGVSVGEAAAASRRSLRQASRPDGPDPMSVLENVLEAIRSGEEVGSAWESATTKCTEKSGSDNGVTEVGPAAKAPQRGGWVTLRMVFGRAREVWTRGAAAVSRTASSCAAWVRDKRAARFVADPIAPGKTQATPTWEFRSSPSEMKTSPSEGEGSPGESEAGPGVR